MTEVAIAIDGKQLLSAIDRISDVNTKVVHINDIRIQKFLSVAQRLLALCELGKDTLPVLIEQENIVDIYSFVCDIKGSTEDVLRYYKESCKIFEEYCDADVLQEFSSAMQQSLLIYDKALSDLIKEAAIMPLEGIDFFEPEFK